MRSRVPPHHIGNVPIEHQQMVRDAATAARIKIEIGEPSHDLGMRWIGLYVRNPREKDRIGDFWRHYQRLQEEAKG